MFSVVSVEAGTASKDSKTDSNRSCQDPREPPEVLDAFLYYLLDVFLCYSLDAFWYYLLCSGLTPCIKGMERTDREGEWGERDKERVLIPASLDGRGHLFRARA